PIKDPAEPSLSSTATAARLLPSPSAPLPPPAPPLAFAAADHRGAPSLLPLGPNQGRFERHRGPLVLLPLLLTSAAPLDYHSRATTARRRRPLGPGHLRPP